MSKTLLTVISGNAALFGTILLLYSERLSVRYNAWTSRLRARHDLFSPPPDARMLASNTAITMWLLRALGVVLLVFSVLAVISLQQRN